VHGLALGVEYSARYHREHASFRVISWMADHADWIPEGDLTPFAQAMPEEYRVPDDAVSAYRAYYMGAKRDIATWAHGPAPMWWR
jgi:hypothetical protein